MMRILRRCLYMMMIGSVLLACQQGVTDVGNPNINKPAADSPSIASPGPTLGQLIGAYSLPQPVTASPAPGGSPTTPSLPACTTDPMAAPSITSTMDPMQIVLNGFLSYGTATDHLVAGYDSKTGALSFQISDASVAITSCLGTVRASGNNISVTLQCKARVSGDSDCQVIFNKDRS